jgi:hypothetical protein
MKAEIMALLPSVARFSEIEGQKHKCVRVTTAAIEE